MNNLLDDKIVFDDASLSANQKAEKLFEHQITNWSLAKSGYDSLQSVESKNFEFENFTITAQFNPGRIVSSSAKVDSKSISERPCFLCPHNLPKDQNAVRLFDEYILLVNPFPIFSKHFTIPVVSHKPQLIKQEIKNLLLISSLLGKNYSVFYNGPKCGASAPDHLHFQAGNFGFMNIDLELSELLKTNTKVAYEHNSAKISFIAGVLRNFIVIESDNAEHVESSFNYLYKIITASDEEPLLNLICYYDETFRLLVFPRTKHRPNYFFEEGEGKILISPASVDLGGIMIFPREEDYKKIAREIIVDVYNQVTFSDAEFLELASKLKEVI